MLSAKCLPSQWAFSNRQGTNKGGDNGTKYEMARVKQQVFIFRITRVHSSLERRVIIGLLLISKPQNCVRSILNLPEN